MTKRHFAAIAAILHDSMERTGDEGTRQEINRITNDLATFCKGENPRFDEGRFFAAVNGS